MEQLETAALDSSSERQLYDGGENEEIQSEKNMNVKIRWFHLWDIVVEST